MSPWRILIVIRAATTAHPSFARAGYIPLHQGATAYRNADFKPGEPEEMLRWLREHGCRIEALPAEGAATERYEAVFADQRTRDAFKATFAERKC